VTHPYRGIAATWAVRRTSEDVSDREDNHQFDGNSVERRIYHEKAIFTSTFIVDAQRGYAGQRLDHDSERKFQHQRKQREMVWCWYAGQSV
jgi:hypothetical protein